MRLTHWTPTFRCLLGVDEELLALTQQRAARLSGVTERQVRYWADTGLIRPLVDERLSPRRSVRLYGFQELMSLLVVADLRGRGISLQHVRSIVARLQAWGYPRPLTEVTFATEGNHLFFMRPDGVWEDGAVPDQTVLQQTLTLEPLRVRIHRAVERDENDVGRIVQRRGTLGEAGHRRDTRAGGDCTTAHPARTQRFADHRVLPGAAHRGRRGRSQDRLAPSCGSSSITTSTSPSEG